MYLGIDIGGTKCALVLGKKDGTIVRKVKFDTKDVNYSNFVNGVYFMPQSGSCGIHRRQLRRPAGFRKRRDSFSSEPARLGPD